MADDTRSYMVVRAFNTSGQESADSNEIMYDPAAAQGGESDDINNVPDENVSPTEEDDQSTQADHSDSDTQEETDTSTVEDSDEGTEQATEDSELEATDEPSTQESADSNGVIYDFDGDTEQAPDDLVLELMDAPSNLTPVPDSTLEGDPPVISWDHVPGAVGYKVRIFDAWEDTVFGSPFLTDSAFSVPQGALSPDATYRYRVYAYKEPFEAENYALMPADASKIDLMLNIAAVDDNGNNIDPETIAHEWLYIAATIRGVDLGIFFYTKDGLKNLETVLVEDPSFISATYDFDHSASDTFSFGKISLKNDLGMVSGDVLIYGYCYTLTDVSEIRVENIVTLNVQ